MGKELESASDVTADVANTNKSSQGVTGKRGDLPSEFEGDRKLFIGYQPRKPMRPANGINKGSEVRSDTRVEGRVVFVRIGVIVLTAVCSITTGQIIGALGMNEVDPTKVRIWGTRLDRVIGPKRKCAPGFETRAGRSFTLTWTMGNSARIAKTPWATFPVL